MEKETKKMKFHLTITDNETGETLHDGDAAAIIGGVYEEDHNAAMLYSNCSALEMAQTLARAEDAVQKTYEDHPELRLLASMAHLTSTKCSKTEGTETPEGQA